MKYVVTLLTSNFLQIMCLDVVVEVVGLEETAKGGGAMGMLAASQLLSTIRMACLELLQ